MSALMSDAEFEAYQEGRRQGMAEFRAGAPYGPDAGRPCWSQGYCDGWTVAVEAADITAALARDRARIEATAYASLDDLLAEFD